MSLTIDSPEIKEIIEDIARKHGRSYSDVREMIMWQYKFVVQKIRESDFREDKYFRIIIPYFGTFGIKRKFKYKLNKYGYDNEKVPKEQDSDSTGSRQLAEQEG